MKKIVIATGNLHKVREFKEMLEPLGYEVLSLKDLSEQVEIIEDGKTFSENALIKARAIHDHFHIAVCADDSGLSIEALNGAPGIYSARFMGEDTSYEIKNQYLIDELNKYDNRKAKYVCAIAYIDIDGNEVVVEGEVHGLINDKQVGSKGFGYDPIFYYPPYETTLANVSEEMKNKISHRAIALQKLLPYVK